MSSAHLRRLATAPLLVVPLLVVPLLVVPLLAGCDPTTADDATRLLERKSATSLSAAEREAFVEAVLQMKEEPSQYDPSLSAYDYFVDLHVHAFYDHGTNAHMAPGFLPWHREFLRRFEAELRRVSGDGSLTLPYWDWTEPGSVDVVFGDDFLGGDGDPDDNHFVVTGPFRKGMWPMAENYDNTDDEVDGDLDPEHALLPEGLQRRFDWAGEEVTLPTKAEVASLLDVPRPYDAEPFDHSADIDASMRNYLEGWWPDGSSMHNAVHVWMGGEMQTGSSPNDPAFFLHHANVDRLWHLWQERYGDDTYPSDGPFARTLPLFEFGELTAEDTFDLGPHSGVVYR